MLKHLLSGQNKICDMTKDETRAPTLLLLLLLTALFLLSRLGEQAQFHLQQTDDNGLESTCLGAFVDLCQK